MTGVPKRFVLINNKARPAPISAVEVTVYIVATRITLGVEQTKNLVKIMIIPAGIPNFFIVTLREKSTEK